MISICIPVYNFNIASLINELSRQLNSLNIQCEIIVIDDCSQNLKTINKSSCEKHTYIELPENIGRAKIRNLFLQYAKYEYLLFLDCDALIKTSSFLPKYIEIIKDNPSVVCGGRVYDPRPPKREYRLKWKYGILRESQPYSVRRKFPNRSFMTNNFLIRKNILEKIKFDERIAQYGHEDTLFGYALKKSNITITHIDNPILNGDVELNSEYLNKTREGIINLIHILNFKEYDNDLINDIALLRFYQKIKILRGIIRLSFFAFKPLTILLLKKGYVNLYLFDYYKLGILIENIKTNLDNQNV
ncbi:family 2 glycosyl transferase [Sporocytophaga myxococcoides]|uniref:Family 2 glycosyl transferase n=1 Tax=Sporocytophaga myxococcoides TaxID=153721 RepID=A0A098LLC1_9BACT|nr:glycosyltransferase family 2 protein [Sporocytophaga myxococcoides]GAL87264.1 family 2 glycosyl transferase [Sporocytophaga myxococcoides]